MSWLFGAQQPVQPNRNLANVKPDRMASNEQTLPLAVFAGRARLGITWLAPALDVTTEEVTTDGGKAGTFTVGHIYYATVAGLVCAGPVDQLRRVWIDGESVWEGNIPRDSNHNDEITIEDWGQMIIYWGTEGQNASPDLPGHPPYLGQCYVVFPGLKFGQDRLQAPNIEIEVERYPQTSLEVVPNSGGDANPAAVLLEWFRDERFGLGLPGDLLSMATFGAMATACEEDEALLSPQVTRQQPFRRVAQELLEYVDGWIRPNKQGKIEVQLARPPAVEELEVLTEADLLEEAEISPAGWEEAYTEVVVVYQDAEDEYIEAAEIYQDSAAFQIVQEPRRLTLQRPWIKDQRQAADMAAAMARFATLPKTTVQFVCRASVAPEIGDLFRLSVEAYGMTWTLRCKERRLARDAEDAMEIVAEVDRHVARAASQRPPRAARPVVVPVAPEAHVAWRVLEVPQPLGDTTKATVTTLVARSHGLITSYGTYLSRDEVSYSPLGSWGRFARTGTLIEAIPKIRPSLYFGGDPFYDLPGAFEVRVELDGHDSTITERTLTECLDGVTLVFINDEIMSLQAVEVVTETEVILRGMMRGLFDTRRQAHDIGDRVYLIDASALQNLTDPSIRKAVTTWWKLPASTSRASESLAAVTAQELLIEGRSMQPLGPLDIRVDGAWEDVTVNAGDDVEINWRIRDWSAMDGALWDRWQEPSPSASEHVIFFYAVALGNVLLSSHRLAPGVDNFIYTAAARDADFTALGEGEQANFSVRVRALYNNQYSRLYPAMEVAVVT